MEPRFNRYEVCPDSLEDCTGSNRKLLGGGQEGVIRRNVVYPACTCDAGVIARAHLPEAISRSEEIASSQQALLAMILTARRLLRP
jgi:hypothetical protein